MYIRVYTYIRGIGLCDCGGWQESRFLTEQTSLTPSVYLVQKIKNGHHLMKYGIGWGGW